MTPDNVQALPLGTQLGDYRLDAVIGQGGFGITYRAFDAQLAKIVAIKEYLPVEFAIRRTDGTVVAGGARYADDFAWGRDRFLDERTNTLCERAAAIGATVPPFAWVVGDRGGAWSAQADSRASARALAKAMGGDRKSTRLNSSHTDISRMPSSA